MFLQSPTFSGIARLSLRFSGDEKCFSSVIAIGARIFPERRLTRRRELRETLREVSLVSTRVVDKLSSTYIYNTRPGLGFHSPLSFSLSPESESLARLLPRREGVHRESIFIKPLEQNRFIPSTVSPPRSHPLPAARLSRGGGDRSNLLALSRRETAGANHELRPITGIVTDRPVARTAGDSAPMAIVTLAVTREKESVISLGINVNNGERKLSHLASTIRRIIMRTDDDDTTPPTTTTERAGGSSSGWFTWVCNVICWWHALRLAVTFMSGHKNARPDARSTAVCCDDRLDSSAGGFRSLRRRDAFNDYGEPGVCLHHGTK